MSPNAKEQLTRLLAILGSIVVVVGVNVPCVWIGSFAINPAREPVLSLAKADWIPAVTILALTGVICGATFARSRRALWLWLGAVLLAIAIPLAWWHLNFQLGAALAKLRHLRPDSPGFEMRWGWLVLAAGGVLQIGTALLVSLFPVRPGPTPAEVVVAPDQPLDQPPAPPVVS